MLLENVARWYECRFQVTFNPDDVRMVLVLQEERLMEDVGRIESSGLLERKSGSRHAN